MFSKYHAATIGKYILELYWISGVLLFIISILLEIGLLFFSDKNIIAKKKQVFSIYKFQLFLRSSTYSRSKNHTSNLLLWEFYKKSPVIFLAFFFVVIQIIALYFTPAITPATDSLYHEYAQKLHGEMNQDKLNFINDEIEFITKNIEDFEQKFLEYKSKVISHDEYNNYLDQYQYSLARQNVIQEIKQYAEYIIECNQKGIDAVFIYDTGIMRLISPQFNWLLFVSIVLFSAPSFTMEYIESSSSSSMSKLLRTTKHGRTKTFHHKIICNILFATISFAIYTVLNVIHVVSWYALDSFSVPMASIQSYYVFGNLSISIFLILTYTFTFVFIVGFSVLAAAFSQIIKNQLIVYLTIFGITVLPHVFSYFGIKDVRYFDFVYLSRGNNVLSIASELSQENQILLAFIFIFLFTLITYGVLMFSKFSYTRRN